MYSNLNMYMTISGYFKRMQKPACMPKLPHSITEISFPSSLKGILHAN